jgi:hypothetical protein
MTSLAYRLYVRMKSCPCNFQPACSSCLLDLKAIKFRPEVFNNLAEIERQFRADARQIEGAK